jgi:hypothetical protein
MNGTIVALMTFAEILSLVQTLPDIAYKLMSMLVQAPLCPLPNHMHCATSRLRSCAARACVVPLVPPTSHRSATARVLLRRCYVRAQAKAALAQTSMTKLAWEMEACGPLLRPTTLPCVAQHTRIGPMHVDGLCLRTQSSPRTPPACATPLRPADREPEGCRRGRRAWAQRSTAHRYEPAEHLVAEAISADAVRHVQRATCSLQRATCSLLRATCSLQRATWSLQRATRSILT